MSAVTVLYIWVLLYSFHHSLTGPCDRPGRTKRGTLRQFIVLTRAPHAVRCQTRGPLAKCGPSSHLVWPAGGSEAFSWLITKSTLLHYVQLQLQQWMSLLKRHVWCVQGSAASPHQLHPGSWSSELRYLGGFFWAVVLCELTSATVWWQWFTETTESWPGRVVVISSIKTIWSTREKNEHRQNNLWSESPVFQGLTQK